MISVLGSALISAVLILIIDSVWLGKIAKGFYVKRMRELADMKGESINVKMGSALWVYFFLVLGIQIFVVQPPAQWPFVNGFVLGMVIYGTYDMTNKATLKKWPTSLAVVDTLWGALLCGTVAWATVHIHAWIGKFF